MVPILEIKTVATSYGAMRLSLLACHFDASLFSHKMRADNTVLMPVKKYEFALTTTFAGASLSCLYNKSVERRHERSTSHVFS